MTLVLFKYVLPIFFGYTIFIGIAGQYSPFHRPIAAQKRPLWFLGLWVGAVMTIIVIAALQLAYQMDLNELTALVTPGLAIIAAALLPGLAIYFWYGWRVRHQASKRSDSKSLSSINQIDNTLASNAQTNHEPNETNPKDSFDTTELDKCQIRLTQGTEKPSMGDMGMDETLFIDVIPTEFNEPRIVNATSGIDSETADLPTCRQEIIRLRDELKTEIHTRKELETHLRITRKGLGVLESESREFESNKVTALIKIEQELEEKVKRTSAAEARADREMSKRVELENEIVHLRNDTLKATTDCRVSTEARASALSAANKATHFARQTMQIRAQLESQLNNAKQELDSKQATISSLIKALEKEKSRTQEDVSSMAKQLRLHEKQLQARRTLEEVSRTVDNKLSTRLVKKVAKARS